MSAIEPGPAPVIVTSVFTTKTEQHQQHLYDLLTANARTILRHAPGFLGSTLTRCDDGQHIVHHAHWRDDAALGAMLADPTAQEHLAAAHKLATAQVLRSHHIERFAAS